MKEYDVTLTITHVEANTPEEAIEKARGNRSAVHNAIGEAVETEK